jgi:uncharacterized protein (DUF1697 family)
MTTYIALLRAVNVGGHQAVTMGALRTLLTDVGFSNVRSLLQSGNLVFRGDPRPSARLERLLEAEAEKRLALTTLFFVRTATEWATLVARNPFPEFAERDPGHLVLMALKDTPTPEAVKTLQAAITGPEVARVDGTSAYITYPVDIGHSRLTVNLIERTLGTRATARNWNTVLKLKAVAEGDPATTR